MASPENCAGISAHGAHKSHLADVLGCQFCTGRMAVVASIQTVQIDVLECLIDYDGGARDPP